MVLHSCGLRNAGVAQELANLLQPAVLVTVCGGWLAANCIRILDIEQDSVIHEVMMTKTVQTEKCTHFFHASFAIPTPKHQTGACVLARRFFGLALFDIETGCLQKFHDMGSYDADLKIAHVPHESLIVAGGVATCHLAKACVCSLTILWHLLPTLISR